MESMGLVSLNDGGLLPCKVLVRLCSNDDGSWPRSSATKDRV